jgi:cation diffusion facilitator CzcD-associated flavoprotein CzcO
MAGEVVELQTRRVVICCGAFLHFGYAPGFKSITDQPHI